MRAQLQMIHAMRHRAQSIASGSSVPSELRARNLEVYELAEHARLYFSMSVMEVLKARVVSSSRGKVNKSSEKISTPQGPM